MSGVVFVDRACGDFVAGVVAGELVGCPCLSADGLAVTQPLVLHVARYAVVIANGCGQGLPNFRFAAEGDFARVIRLRLWVWIRLRIWRGDVSNRRCCFA